MPWPRVPLRELCTFRHGGTPSKSNPQFWRGDIPWISPKDMKQRVIEDATDHISDAAIQESAASTVPPGSILIVVRSGILVHSLPIAQVGRLVAFNQDIKAVVPKGGAVDADFLYWFLRSSEPRVLAQGVKKGTVHSLSSGFIESLEVTVPLPEQRRIVDLLSRAEGIVRLRRDAQKKAAELMPAIFMEMFGDPATNPKGWPRRRVGDFVAKFEGGKNLQAGSDGATPYRILKVSAVTTGSTRKPKASQRRTDTCRPGTTLCVRVICFSRGRIRLSWWAPRRLSNAQTAMRCFQTSCGGSCGVGRLTLSIRMRSSSLRRCGENWGSCLLELVRRCETYLRRSCSLCQCRSRA